MVSILLIPQVQSPAPHESTAEITVSGYRLEYQHCKMNLTELLNANTILGLEQKLSSSLHNEILTSYFLFISVKLT